jgi:hypothetical protein
VKDEVRYNEIKTALLLNLGNDIIKKIVVLDEGFYFGDINSKKLIIYPISKRPTFNDVMRFCEKDEINIIANNDISFGKTLIHTLKYLRNKKSLAYALSRWESDGTIFRNKFSDSQDAWVVWSNFEGQELVSNFFMGIPGCDNRFAYDLEFKYKRKVFNPSKTIKVFHHHKSQSRVYSKNDQIKGDYLLLKPTNLFTSSLIYNFSFLERFVKWKIKKL